MRPEPRTAWSSSENADRQQTRELLALESSLVVAVGRPVPDNRNDCKAWEEAGANPRPGTRRIPICERPEDKRLLPGGTTYHNRPYHGDRYELMVRDQRNLSFPKKEPDHAPERHRVTLVTVTYDGRLTVTDPDRMRHTLTQGLGKAKAYGCGLMTLVPLPPTAK